MKKSLKSLSILMVMVLVFGFTGSITSFASSKLSYSKYLNLQEDGIIGEDVTYEYLQEMQAESEILEKQLEENDNFVEVNPKEFNLANSFNSLERGDVIITNATSSAGLTGHAGIAVSKAEILHIEGPGKKPSIINTTEWKKKYPSGIINWTKVYRSVSPINGSRAAQWARNTYRSSNATYKITMDLASTHETYCSKIVWQAYYYGAGKSHTDNPPTLKGIRLPYDLPTTVKSLTFKGNL